MAFVDFKELKERVSITDGVSLLALSLNEKGTQLRGKCPVCGGNDRSLVVTPEKGLWYCFTKKIGGDVIALVAHIRDCSVKDAAQWLAGDKEDATPPRERSTATTGISPLSYLQPDHESVERLGVLSETAQEFGAGYANKGVMRGRFAIPIYAHDSTLVAYCGRAVKEDDSPVLKFPNGFDPEHHIFNADRVSGGELHLTRDPIDVLIAHQNGIENCVAFLTETITAHQLEQLASLMDETGSESVELY